MWKFFTAQGAEKRTSSLTTPVVVKLLHSANQSIPNATVTVLTFDTEIIDTDVMHDNTNPTRITVKTAGRYQLHGSMLFAANTTGIRDLYIRINGTAEYKAISRQSGSVNGNYIEANVVLDLAAGEYVELFAYQDSGGALNSSVGTGNVPRFSAHKIDGAVVSYVGVPGSLVGQELAYSELTASLVSVTATTAATGQQVVAAPAITLNGSTPILIELSAPRALAPNGANFRMQHQIWDSSTRLPVIGENYNGGVWYHGGPFYAAWRTTPAVGSHTYIWKAFVPDGGTGSVTAGTGAADNFVPAFIRITRVA